MTNPMEIEISKAVYRFRVRIQEEKKSAVFHNMRAIVRTAKDENMRNLIEAGRGEILHLADKYIQQQTCTNSEARNLIEFRGIVSGR